MNTKLTIILIIIGIILLCSVVYVYEVNTDNDGLNNFIGYDDTNNTHVKVPSHHSIRHHHESHFQYENLTDNESSTNK